MVEYSTYVGNLCWYVAGDGGSGGCVCREGCMSAMVDYPLG